MTNLTGETVLLTLGRLPAALELARALAAAGARVLVAEPFAWHLCRLSRAVSGSFRVASPAQDTDRWCRDLVQIVAGEQVTVVMPVSEEILFVARLVDRLPTTCRLQCGASSTLMRLHDKWQFHCLARDLRLPVPATWLASDPLAAHEVGTGGFVIKPRLSCSGNGVSLHAGDHLPPTLDRDAGRVVQQRLDGPSCCTLTLASNGRVVATVAYRSLVDFGSVSVCFEAIEPPGMIVQGVADMVSHLKYSGFIGFDALADDAGRWCFIECNPRTTSGVHLLSAELLASAIAQESSASTGTPSTGPPAAIAGPVRQEFWSNLSVFMGKLLRARVDAGHLRRLLATRDVTWSWRDPLPFLLSSVVLMPLLLRALRTRRPVVQLITEDVGCYDTDYPGAR